VRFTGQDSERGTFSQRHLVLHDHQTGEKVIPLARLGAARFEVYNSPLSETGVMGFEYGYSVASEKDYVLWEAQFGDFVNVAQPIIDQFMASGRTKWGQLANLTLLLPTATRGRARSTPPPASSASSSSAPRTTCGWRTPRPRPSTSTSCGGRRWEVRSAPSWS
jgi:2-oxoglutarate dehydrogenase complex dehydrogenase (E1) component-like enzyme